MPHEYYCSFCSEKIHFLCPNVQHLCQKDKKYWKDDCMHLTCFFKLLRDDAELRCRRCNGLLDPTNILGRQADSSFKGPLDSFVSSKKRKMTGKEEEEKVPAKENEQRANESMENFFF